jgi:cell division protein FtsN
LANYERGVYEPSNEVRVFDGSEEEDDVEGSRLPLLIVLALLVLAMFAGVVWLAYTQGVARGRGETPVLTAASGPERVAPQSAGGNNVPYQGFKIYEQPAAPDDSADAAVPAKPANVAPAATPAAEAPKPAPVAAAPAPVVAAPKPAPVVAAPKPAPAPIAAAPKPVATAPAKLAAAPAAAKPAPVKPAAAPPKSVAALIQQANSTPVAETPKPVPAAKAITPPPAMKPAMTTAAPAPLGGPATGAPRQLGAPVPAATAPKAAAAPAPVAAKPAATGGAYVLQIGAYKSQADADAAWKSYKAKHAALLSGYSDDVQQADLGEKGTWYRLRVGGLSDREVASALCDRLKADGGACILGK